MNIFKRFEKRVRVRIPSGKSNWHLVKRRPSHHHCGNCRAKLNKARLNTNDLKKLSKTQKRPERIYPELCSNCMREKLKFRVRQ